MKLMYRSFLFFAVLFTLCLPVFAQAQTSARPEPKYETRLEVFYRYDNKGFDFLDVTIFGQKTLCSYDLPAEVPGSRAKIKLTFIGRRGNGIVSKIMLHNSGDSRLSKAYTYGDDERIFFQRRGKPYADASMPLGTSEIREITDSDRSYRLGRITDPAVETKVRYYFELGAILLIEAKRQAVSWPNIGHFRTIFEDHLKQNFGPQLVWQ